MTWLDVTDDAIKIGLGVFLGGLFSLLLLRLTHRHELRKELLRRKQDSLQKVAEEFETFHSKLMNLISVYCAHLTILKQEGLNPPDTHDILGKFNDLHGCCLRLLPAIEAKLLLLGLNDSAKPARIYGFQAVEPVTAMKLTGALPQVQDIQQKMQTCDAVRGQFYGSLKSAYLKVE